MIVAWRTRRLSSILVGTTVLASCFLDVTEVRRTNQPVDPTPLEEEPTVWVSSPTADSRFNREVLFSDPGLAVELEGAFVPGQTLNLMASTDVTPGIGFSIQQFVLTDTLSPGTFYVQTYPLSLGNASAIWLRLRVFTASNEVLSVDSVRVRFR